MTTTQPIEAIGAAIERGSASPVRSHQSYGPNVEAICHHSGQYLTRSEANPESQGFLREQHDFPGYPALDDLFANAAHARAYQHLTWSTPAVQALAMVIGALLLALGVVPLYRRAEQWQTTVEYILIYGLLIVVAVLILLFPLRAFVLLRNRKAIYHRRAAGARPAFDDFPVLGTYKIDVLEEVTANLRNDRRQAPIVQSASGNVSVELRPAPNTPDNYATYRTVYAAAPVGNSLHAGAIAIEELQYVQFHPDLEYGHRMVLRQSIIDQFAPSGTATTEPITFQTHYDILPEALYKGVHEGQRFLIDLQPELKHFDSYTMILRFRWLSVEPLPSQLEECRLNIPAALTPVTRFDLGRYVPGPQGGEIIWRKLPFIDGEVVLSVTFGAALIDQLAVMTGSYRIVCDGTVSGLDIRADRIWNALGRHATERTQPSIRSRSVISGALHVNTELLSQEHEYVFAYTIETEQPPDHHLVEQIERVLSTCGVDIQKIEQATTRLDPSGKLEHELRYWDIAGRRYEESVLEAVDVHIVITGSDASGGRIGESQSHIDVRVRCLHDPRNQTTVMCALTTGQELVRQLNESIGTSASAVGGNGSSGQSI